MARSAGGWPLALFAAFVLALAWGEIFAPLASSTFGIILRDDGSGAVVERIIPGSDAELAGIRAGDAVDARALSFSDRIRLHTGSAPGTTVDVRTRHDGVWNEHHLTATVRAKQFRAPVAFLINATLTLLVVAVIAFRVPSLATAALVLYGCGAVTSFGIAALFSWLPNPLYGGVASIVIGAFSELPLFALLVFITRFPAAPASPAARMRMHAGDAIFITAVVAYGLGTLFEPVLFASWAWAHDALDLMGTFAIIVLAVLAYREAPGTDRHRIGWVLVGFLVSAVFYVGSNMVIQTVGAASARGPGLQAFLSLLQCGQCILALTLAYAVLRHRVLDLGFALNRTLVYGTLTACAVVFISVVDWISARMLVETRLELALEAAVAIAFGVGLNWFHVHIEGFLDRTIFRERHLAEKRIESRIKALGYATSEAEIETTLTHEVSEVLRLVSTAVFRRDFGGEFFNRVAATGWADSDLVAIDPDSLLARTVVASEEPLFLTDLAIHRPALPDGPLGPVLAIPIASQHELVAIALYGLRADSVVPDPEEVALLGRLAHAAGAAYSIVDARRWRRIATELQTKLASGANPA